MIQVDIQIDIQGRCLRLDAVLIIHKVISLLPSRRNILFIIAPLFPGNPPIARTITSTAAAFAVVSYGPLALNGSM